MWSYPFRQQAIGSVTCLPTTAGELAVRGVHKSGRHGAMKCLQESNYGGNPYRQGQGDAIGLEYLDRLYSYAMAMTRNRTEAEDLVQETYMRAMRAARRLKPDSNIKSWLFTILRNVWLNQLRKRHRDPQMIRIDGAEWMANSIVDPSKDSLNLYIDKVEAEQVQAAILNLPVESREVILLREYEYLSYGKLWRSWFVPSEP
jgi:RNA polymerase sigma-70 factor, ECF subfamily